MYSRLVFFVVEYTLLIAFNCDLESSIDEFLGRGGCKSSASLERLLLAAQPECRRRHLVLEEDMNVEVVRRIIDSRSLDRLKKFLASDSSYNSDAHNLADRACQITARSEMFR